MRVFASLLAGMVGLSAGCSVHTQATATQDDPIAAIPQTETERQSIGDSWLYAEAMWVGALTDGAVVPSPAYWAYWHAFDQIAGGFGTTIATGGNWKTAGTIVLRYGLAPADAFAASATRAEAAARRDAALAAMNASLATGALADAGARKDRALVRRELDRAWALDDAERAMLDQVFGADVSRAFSGTSTVPDPSGTAIRAPADVAVAYTSGPGTPRASKRLVDAIREWRVTYLASSSRDAFFGSIEHAIDANEPALLTWFVDFDALEVRDNGRRGAFNLATLTELGPGPQAGDTAMISGYTTDALRVIAPWGTATPDRVTAAGAPREHDLYRDYLVGPIRRCSTATSCPYTQVPLQDVVLPPGY